MAGRKLTVGQKRSVREKASAKVEVKAKTSHPIDKLIADLNRQLGGVGRVYTGAEYESRTYARRSTGIPSLDYILGGGLPVGGLVEFGGEYSTGKSTIALHMCAREQRVNKGAVAWVSLEPFSKRWARENGFFLPFNDSPKVDPHTGEIGATDAYAGASELELFRMSEAGITDPYADVSRFVIIEDSRGDEALDACLTLLESNQFSLIVVDSLGIAKSTAFLEERGVRDAGDYDRTPKMIGDYTARACLMLNKRYDENNMPAKDGQRSNGTTLINLNQIVTTIGTQARTPWKKQTIKGGEGNKHNHHAIVFLSKGEQKSEDTPHGRYVYGHEIRAITIKSKICAPFKESSFDLYTQPFGAFRAGDIDVAKDVVQLALIAGLITRSGAWFECGENKTQGREKMEELVRGSPELQEWLRTESIRVLNK